MDNRKKMSIHEDLWLKIDKLKGNKTFNEYVEEAINRYTRLAEENKRLKLEIEELKEKNGHNDKYGNAEDYSKCDYFAIGDKPNTVFCGKDWIGKGKIRTVPINFCRQCWEWTQTTDEDEDDD